ncbi:MAG: TonB-dependent receptor [Bacteroidota bacterium]
MKLKLTMLIALCLGGASLWAQNTVTGNVTDRAAVPLIGVNILVEGTSSGTITDLDGNFELEVQEGASLRFTYTGYKDQVIVVGTQTNLMIEMAENATVLDEVVVVGYGTTKKSDLTGSIASVSAEQLTIRPVQSVGQALQGQATGVQVRTNSAAPGGGASVIIRGQNSVNSSSSPLYVLDGIPLSNIDNISVEDIESIEVLKDGSSTAIYGSRGANGVILITSKKGKIGNPKVSYSTRLTTETFDGGHNLMNGREFAEIFTEWETAIGTPPENVFYNGSSPTRPLPAETGEGTDWFDAITRNGFLQNHQINFSSGNEFSTTSVSLNYLNHEGVITGSDYNRLGLRLANQLKVTSWLSTGVNLFVTRENINSVGENTSGQGGAGIINQAIKMSPALPIFNEDGSYTANNFPGAQGIENPLATANEVIDERKNWDIIGNFYLTVSPLKNLSFRTSIGGDFNNFKRGTYNPTNTITGGLLGGSASIANSNRTHLVNENILSYSNLFSNRHQIDAVAGMTYEEETFENFSVSATDFFTDVFGYDNIDAAGEFGKPFSGKNKWQLLSYLGRVNYTLDSKYFLSVSGRYDGSSRFGAGNKFGFFPAVSGAWVLSSEDFMENSLDVINTLKFRAGWARTGNQNIGLQQSLALFNGANYPVGTSIEAGVAASRLENSNLKWETTESINIGLDARLFKIMDLTLDFYEKTTTDLLLNVALIETSGFSNALLNTGELRNRGFEVSLNTKVVNNKDFQFSIRTDFFLNRNEIVSLVGDATQAWRIGNPLGADRGYIPDGIIQNQEELEAFSDANGNPINGLTIGEEKAVDLNGDGILDINDQVIVFDPNPDFSYAISPSFAYKNVTLDLFFYGVQGNQIRNNTASFFRNTNIIRTNLTRDLLGNYWTPDNPDAYYPRLGGNNSFHTNRINIEDGSYLRLQNVRLVYTLPKTSVFESISVYLSAQNLFTITDYTGFDPDVNSTPGNSSLGVDRNSYPVPKSYTFGLNVNF